MSELFLGLFIGSSAMSMNPVKLFIGWVMLIVSMTVIAVTIWVIWMYAPLAEVFVQSLGIVPTWLIKFLHIESVADGDIVAHTIQLSKRLILCSIALFVIAVGIRLFNLTLYSLIKLVAKLSHKSIG